jgi:hypothetical protein
MPEILMKGSNAPARRRQHAWPGFDERHHAVGPAVLLFGHHGADSGRIGRPLECVANPVDRIRHIQEPELHVAGGEQDQQPQGGESRRQVADHHHQLAVVAVHHHPGDGGEDQEGRDECHLHQAHGGGAFGLLVHPDGQAKASHAGGHHGDDLAQPTMVKANMPGG